MGCPEPSVPRDYNITHCMDNKSSLTEWVSFEVNINSSGKSIGNAEERGSKIVSPSMRIDTTLKVPVTTEHTHCNKITLPQKDRTLFLSVYSFSLSLTHTIIHSPTRPHTHSRTHPLTHPPTHLLTHPLNQSITHPHTRPTH